MKEGLAYLDGKTMDLAKARVPLNDRGYLLGDGVFETMRSSNGHVFRLADHEARIGAGLEAIGLDAMLAMDFHDAVDALAKAGKKEFGSDLYLRVNITTGPMDDVAGSDRGITVTGIVKKFKPYPMQYYSNGIHVITSTQRKDSTNPLSRVKTMSFLPYVAARREAHAATVHDALLLNEHGRVAEASTSNVFALRKGVVHSPGAEEGAIPGVTRAAVLELVKEADLDIVERLDLATLGKADEVWLTNTSGGIVPVTRFADKTVAKGKKGELTTQLSHALEAQIRGNHHARRA